MKVVETKNDIMHLTPSDFTVEVLKIPKTASKIEIIDFFTEHGLAN